MADIDRDRHGSGAGKSLSGGQYYTLRVQSGALSNAQIKGSQAGPPDGRALPMPTVKVSPTGKVTVTGGAAALTAARAAGATSVPVAMTQRSAANAHRAGMTVRTNATFAGPQYAGRMARHGVHIARTLSVSVDLTDMARVAAAMHNTARSLEQIRTSLSRALNDGMMRFDPALARRVQAWTGLRDRGRARQNFYHTPSSPATLTAVLRISDRHLRITNDYFGAAYSRGSAGASHRAWNRQQIAVGSFMLNGKKPIFVRDRSQKIRTQRGRMENPIFPIWGPNVAREVDRHHGEVQAMLSAVATTRVGPTAARLLRIAVARSA